MADSPLFLEDWNLVMVRLYCRCVVVVVVVFLVAFARIQKVLLLLFKPPFLQTSRRVQEKRHDDVL